MSEQQFNQPTVETTTALSTQPTNPTPSELPSTQQVEPSTPSLPVGELVEPSDEPITGIVSHDGIINCIFHGHKIRHVIIDDQAFFVAKDVAVALGYKEPTNAIRTHCCGDEDGGAKYTPIEDTLGRTQEVRVIDESDIIRLVISSKLPKAREFERWIMKEVIPSVLKTGSYTHPTANNNADQELIALQRDYIALQKQHIALLSNGNPAQNRVAGQAFSGRIPENTPSGGLRRWYVTPDEIAHWVSLYEQGFTFHAISRMVGRAKNTVHCHITAALTNGGQNV